MRSGYDDFWVEDTGNAKLMLFSGDSLARTVSTRENPTVSRGMMPSGVSADGDLLMTTSSYDPDIEEPWLHGSMTRFNPTTGILDTVGSYPKGQRLPDGLIHPFLPYGEVTSTGGGFVHARSDVAEVTWRDASGAVAQIVRWEPTLDYPTSDTWNEFEASMRVDLRRVNPRLSGDDLQIFLNQQVARFEVDYSRPLP